MTYQYAPRNLGFQGDPTMRSIIAFSAFIFASFTALFISQAQAMDLDWHGQFRAETNWLWGYSHGNLLSNAANVDTGYTIPYNGSSPASYQNLFLRLDPRAIVSDNATIYTDIWVGTPDSGFFGSDLTSQGKFNSTSTGRATMTVNEFYAELATDFGTFKIGRAPLNWGLGLVWNNSHAMFDRMPSTGDVIGLTTKLGAFKLMPTIVKYRAGSNLGGTYNSAGGGSTQEGWSGATDYTLGLTYNNPDEQLDGGILFLRRISGANAPITNPISGYGNNSLTAATGSYSYNLWDFFFKKKVNVFTVAVEVPLTSGQFQGVNYSSVAAAVQAKAELNEHWTIRGGFGQADGQDNTSATGSGPTKMTAFYFHPDYRPGLIMFNFNRKNFSSGSGVYNDPVTNARFFSLGVDYGTGKWSYSLEGLTASALYTADGVLGNAYFNTQDGTLHAIQAGASAQRPGMGVEVDYKMGYQWDESVRLGVESGLLFPGKFYEFSNSAVVNKQKVVFATVMNVSVKF